MPKLLTDEQIANIKSAMDLLEETDKKNKELKSQYEAISREFDRVCKENQKLVNEIKDLKDEVKVYQAKIDDFEVVDDEQFSSYFSYLYKKEEKK